MFIFSWKTYRRRRIMKRKDKEYLVSQTEYELFKKFQYIFLIKLRTEFNSRIYTKPNNFFR